MFWKDYKFQLYRMSFEYVLLEICLSNWNMNDVIIVFDRVWFG